MTRHFILWRQVTSTPDHALRRPGRLMSGNSAGPGARSVVRTRSGLTGPPHPALAAHAKLAMPVAVVQERDDAKTRSELQGARADLMLKNLTLTADQVAHCQAGQAAVAVSHLNATVGRDLPMDTLLLLLAFLHQRSVAGRADL
jgi:hypothetical protein